MLTEGDVIELTTGDTVYTEIVVGNDESGGQRFVQRCVTLEDQFNYLVGKYVVTKTTQDGGRGGHGLGDIYPDGHHVFCTSLDGKYKVDFYQSGNFEARLTDKTAIGKAILTWVLIP